MSSVSLTRPKSTVKKKKKGGSKRKGEKKGRGKRKGKKEGRRTIKKKRECINAHSEQGRGPTAGEAPKGPRSQRAAEKIWGGNFSEGWGNFLRLEGGKIFCSISYGAPWVGYTYHSCLRYWTAADRKILSGPVLRPATVQKSSGPVLGWKIRILSGPVRLRYIPDEAHKIF